MYYREFRLSEDYKSWTYGMPATQISTVVKLRYDSLSPLEKQRYEDMFESQMKDWRESNRQEHP